MKRNILLNPGPATTTDSVKQALCVPDLCPREPEFCLVVEEVRKQLVQVVHGQEAYVCVPFAASGTGAVEACISSVLKPGQKILIHVNGAYGTRMADIARTYYEPTSVLVYEQPYGQYPDLKKIETLLQEDSSIHALGFIHHETTTGMLNPAEDLLSIAQKYEVQLVVDAMSSFAGIPIDVRKHSYDYLISSSNKCLQGMAGISFVLCKQSSLREMETTPTRNYYLSLWRQYEALEKTGQMPFTPPVQLFYALRQALKELFLETVEGRSARYQACWKVIQDGLRKIELEPFLEEKYQSRLLTTVREPKRPGYHFMKMHDSLYQQGFTIYPGKMAQCPSFRLANIGAITPTDMIDFIKALHDHFQTLE